LQYSLRTQKQRSSDEEGFRKYDLKSVAEMLNTVIGGCPKRNICSFHKAKSKTCSSGPYRYCGKYRSIAENQIEEQNLPNKNV
jgi:hypothetical protein